MFAYTKDNKIIHIKNALPETDYYCGYCGGRLRVRNGNIRIKHFYHINDDCGDRGESFVHKCWKKYFLKLKKFDNFNIIKAEEEFPLLNGTYIPDVILKTDKNNYIIIEVDYKNSKDKNYLEKFKLLPKTFIKVFEVKVAFGKILETKILFNREKEKELQIKIEKKRKYILEKYYKKGGLVYEITKNNNSNLINPIPILFLSFDEYIPVKYENIYNDFTWELIKKYKKPPSSRRKKIKIHLEEKTEEIKVKSNSFFITIYDYKEMYDYCKRNNVFSIKLVSQDINLKGDINIVLDEE